MDDLAEYQFLIPSLHHIVNRRTYRSWHVPRGRHHFHNIMLIVGGEGAAWTEGVKTELRPGILVYHPVEEEFGYETSQENLLHCLGGNFSLSALEPGYHELKARYISKLPLATYTTLANLERLTRLFSDLALAWGRGTNNNTLHCRSLFMSILDELLSSQIRPSQDGKQLERIHRVVKYMEANCERKITLTRLAELAGLTPSYFGQVFRQVKGVTPVEYLNSIRIDRALHWMESGCSLSEAAAKVGFNDPFYFSRVFKKNKGICPSEYMNPKAYF
jgi:AraC-like DNA-binding protein